MKQTFVYLLASAKRAQKMHSRLVALPGCGTFSLSYSHLLLINIILSGNICQNDV